jgi:hypothetical protein
MSPQRSPVDERNFRIYLLAGLAFLGVAFAGVLAGNWFTARRNADRLHVQAENWRRPSPVRLSPGDDFPAEELVDLDGRPIATADLMAGRRNLVLFLAPGCQPCELAVAAWRQDRAKLPADVGIWAIVPASVAEVQPYLAAVDFPFAAYCDLDYRFPEFHGLRTFPAVLGLDSGGRVVFLVEGYREDFHLHRALELFDN